jgi:polyhydroxybutyrate depolymerase
MIPAMFRCNRGSARQLSRVASRGLATITGVLMAGACSLAADGTEFTTRRAQDLTAAVDAASTDAGSASPADAGDASASSAPVPSAGCGKAGRPEGGTLLVEGDHIYDFPSRYDGNTPLPLVFGFHANANPNTQLRDATRGTAIETDFVQAFPKSTGEGWSRELDSPRFDAWLAELENDFCIDTSRIFAFGHSSGAQFIEGLLCQGEERLRAVAPSAGAATCSSWRPTATLLIHGVNDTERANSGDANGQLDLAGYLASNQCSPISAPQAVDGCLRGERMVNPGCVRFEGCSATTLFCNHDDPNYADTNHGWPCFASRTIAAFFQQF